MNLYCLNLPSDILIIIRKYIGKHKLAVIYLENLERVEFLSKEVDYQDLMYHFYRHYELFDDEPDFCLRWRLITKNSSFKEWKKMYKWWLLWEGVLFNKLFGDENDIEKNEQVN